MTTSALATVNDPPHGGINLYDLRTAAEFSGMHPEMILEFLRAQLVETAHRTCRDELYFDERAICRLRQIQHFRARHFSLHSVCIVVRLLDRAEKAEKELKKLRELHR